MTCKDAKQGQEAMCGRHGVGRARMACLVCFCVWSAACGAAAAEPASTQGADAGFVHTVEATTFVDEADTPDATAGDDGLGPDVGHATGSMCEAYCERQQGCTGVGSPGCVARCQELVAVDPGVEERFACAASSSCDAIEGCGGAARTPANDSCPWARTGVCLEPIVCAPGTDKTDCGAPDLEARPTCSAVCERLRACVGYADERVIDTCADRCPVALYEGDFSTDVLECAFRAEVCQDVRSCVQSVAVCESLCEAMVSCGSFRDASTCRVWCGGQVLAGALPKEKALCLQQSAAEGRCERQDLQICLAG